MFQDRIIHWTKIFDLFMFTKNTAIVLAKKRTGTLFARNHQSRMHTLKLNMDPRREMANAQVQISRLNR